MYLKWKNLTKVGVLSLAALIAFTPAVPTIGATGAKAESPNVETRVKEVLTLDGESFRDLNANGEVDTYEDWRLPVEERVDNLISQMTVEEKAGLMLISSFNNQSSRVKLQDDHLRYFIIRDDPEPRDLATRNNEFQELGEASRLGIPVVMTSNPRNHVNPNQTYGHAEAGGQLSTWPGELGLAATQDPELVKEFAETAATEWRATGIHKLYGYMADLLTEPRWTRTDGTFGEDPELVSEMITSIVEGFQGEELGENSVSLTIKHFAGGGPRVEGTDPHHEWGSTNEYPTEGSLYNYHLPPFMAAIAAGPTSIMPYYAKPVNDGSAIQLPKHLWYNEEQQFEEVAFAYNERMLQGLLRNELGFDGYVNSDTSIIEDGARIWGVERLTEAERYAKAIGAGTNMFSGGTNVEPLLEAINTGLVEETAINHSVSFLLTEMFDLGLFENPYVDPEHAQEIADDVGSQALADEAHRKSIVLLRNGNAETGQVLPISDKEVQEVKLYVEIFMRDQKKADEASIGLRESFKLADPSLQLVNTPEEATHAYLSVMPTLSWSTDDTENDPPSIELKKNADTGIDSERILKLQNEVATTILGVNMTNPWLINEIEPGADAVLATFNTTPDAIVDIIRGNYNPTGKMPFTVPADIEAVENNASDVPGYAETFDYAYTNANGDDYALNFGLSYKKEASDIIETVDQFADKGAFANNGTVNSLKAMLSPVENFEKKGDADKVIHHVEKFIMKLEQYKKKNAVSEEAYIQLKGDATELINAWQ
ncbi:beta-glucosidase [Oceanobacillus arenosus]|uniref:beta-glucosidase n=1 Tax=Oceanobacillus arenosus TaxID=1229153 RepID=A0A3D8Q0B2_9BACI|nr:glycoside hydrolase family 3 N-terminal domain-containing protein [Oceanobacillus arenosus]RDW21890.1 beta-glucosidase [Oceanobacillus arenosus]